MFDLVGMALRDKRAKQKVTKLQRAAGWTRELTGQLACSLMTEGSSLPAQPEIFLLYGEYEKSRLVGLIGSDDFTLEIITGLDSEQMPWRTGW